MTGIGEVASILTLLQTAGSLAEKSFNFARRLKNAPKELHDLSERSLVVKAELEHLKQLPCCVHADLLTDELSVDFKLALAKASINFGKAEAICVASNGNEHWGARIRWVSKGRKHVVTALDEVEKVRSSLHTLMHIIECRNISLISRAMQDLKDHNFPTNDSGDEKKSAQPGATALAYQKETDIRRLQSDPWSFGLNWLILGINGGLIPTIQGPYRDYFLAMQVSMPLLWLAGHHILTMSLSVRTFPLYRYHFRFLPGTSLALSRVVSKSDPFMDACDRGDLLAVREMLRSGRGRPSDVTDGELQNWTPLAFAIRSGNCDVVTELINNGADIEAPVGKLQTTPLQWAIWNKQLDVTRLLIRRKACHDYINRWGWNVAFFCWPKLQRSERCMLDFLRVLGDESILDLEIADIDGWTALHRVAAFGLPEEITAIIQLGAKPEQVAEPLRWNAIHHAVYYGNYATFQELLPYYDKSGITLVDERGWTLLHIAASAGHDKIVRRLLELGSDPFALSRPFRSHMPESLYRRACTPREVAAAQSEEKERKYLEALDALGLSVRVSEVDDDDEEDQQIFWEAQESFVFV